MNTTELQGFIGKILSESPENSLKIYFSRWASSKYVSHLPQLTNELQSEIMQIVLAPLRDKLCQNALVQYNPVGVADGEIEKLESSLIPQVSNFKESISDENVFKQMQSLEISKIDFYCFEISFNGQAIFLFRQFQKMKRLRKGVFAQIVNDELKSMDGNFLGIDETIDIVIFGDDVYLLNHISLERIFKYKDEFLKKTNEALGELLTKNVIENVEQFTEDCCRDIRIMKRFTNIMTKGRLPLFFDNFEKVEGIVKELELDIDFGNDGRMIYKDRSQLFHIVNLLSDSYFKSLIADRTGLAKIESEV